MISQKAQIGKDTIIKPYTNIEDDVIIGNNVEIGPNAFIGNGSRISDNVKILHASSISVWPNSISYNNEKTTVEIGEGTIIKGLTTVCKGTVYSYKTVIGKNCYLMNHVHVAHDNIIGDNVILTNGVNLGGHVEIGDFVMVGGLVGVHQFCRIGESSMIGACLGIKMDAPPYSVIGHWPSRFVGVNIIGLKRRGFSSEKINEIKDAYRIIYFSGYNFSDALKKLKDEMPMSPEIEKIINFFETTKRGVMRARD